MGNNMFNWYRKFKANIKKTNVPVVKIHIPIVPKVIKEKKEIMLIDPIFLRERKLQITHCLVHHSTTKDGLKNDWSAIDIYHRSFRWNWTIMVPPITDFEVLQNILEGKDKNAIKINYSYYQLDKVEQFYKRATALTGEALQVGQYFSKYERGAKIETPWSAIGYTIGTEREGNELVMRYGRSLQQKQAHCYQERMNLKAIGWLVVGDYDKYNPDSDLWRYCIKVAREIKKEIPKIRFLGHREVKGVKKSCPGELWDMKQFREDIKIRRRK